MAEASSPPGRVADVGEGSASWEGSDERALADRLGLPRVILRDTVASTLDIAHAAAADGAVARTLVLADRQTAGRGRHGRAWVSKPGSGVWLTMLARRMEDRFPGVLSIRLALQLAAALDVFVAEPVRVKWPNDLHTARGKLAGVLAESRWQGPALSWVAVGVGINVRAPRGAGLAAASLAAGTSRLEVLDAVVPALVRAIDARGPLDDDELAAWQARDLARGRRVTAPASGVVVGIARDGALLVDTDAGIVSHHGGSLVLDPSAARP